MWIPKGAALIRGRRLFEVRRLLEKIRYPNICIHTSRWYLRIRFPCKYPEGRVLSLNLAFDSLKFNAFFV